jgi:hypothetical protein
MFFQQNICFLFLYQNLIKIVFFKNSNQHKMAIDLDFQASGGSESLWTTGKKSKFYVSTGEVPKQPHLIFF